MVQCLSLFPQRLLRLSAAIYFPILRLQNSYQCTPSGTPATPRVLAYTSSGKRAPAEPEARNRKSRPCHGFVRTTPAPRKSTRPSCAASSGCAGARTPASAAVADTPGSGGRAAGRRRGARPGRPSWTAARSPCRSGRGRGGRADRRRARPNPGPACTTSAGAAARRRSPCPRRHAPRSGFRPKSEDLVRRDGPTEPLQIEIAHGRGVDAFFNGSEDVLADQDLTRGGAVAQPRGQVDHRPERCVVVASFVSDPAERGVPGLDPDPEAELRPTLAPHARQLCEPLLGGDRERIA